jgi:hypothetical protein
MRYELDEEYKLGDPGTAHDVGAGLRRHFPEIHRQLGENAGQDPTIALAVDVVMAVVILIGAAL